MADGSVNMSSHVCLEPLEIYKMHGSALLVMTVHIQEQVSICHFYDEVVYNVASPFSFLLFERQGKDALDNSVRKYHLLCS